MNEAHRTRETSEDPPQAESPGLEDPGIIFDKMTDLRPRTEAPSEPPQIIFDKVTD